ncbi:protein FAR1-RELATED SEQUENCE 5-like [Olea europaea var. sylvestris]|uniref:protein FAR1-RELATED SEQUENCE 5-like n=1 Tax=Olea europaea var. sylvestris TaxID=158386 RepID=UPI000C1D4C70|nr:protein FAR1-RELATED SEQUENCE 5-like [Olea europaea var. sylvestris]
MLEIIQETNCLKEASPETAVRAHTRHAGEATRRRRRRPSPTRAGHTAPPPPADHESGLLFTKLLLDWKIEVNDLAGIPLHKSFNSAVVEAGGYENLSCVEKDCSNYIEKVRRLKLGEGDAAAIQSYFSEMQAECSGFYFSIDLDEDSRLRNVFWADNRCRQAYKEFRDIVTFDTTYLTNKYDMPFAPFVDVNHHGQSTLFGCGLLSNENTDTFVWLFMTWLKCMHSQAPHGIITDQDRATQNAIQIVFPDTKHRWCLWHILKKLPEKFGYHVDKGSICSTIHVLVYDSQNVEEFEAGWKIMIDKYELEDSEWLSGLYENRGRWVPCFLKISFWAGMSSTQRSKSMNAFFDGYVHSKRSLKQFVEQYERTLRNKVEKEFQADFKSFSQMVPCATTYEIEQQFQAVYTISKFREVQQSSQGRYIVTSYLRRMFIQGRPTRHAIAVLIRNDVRVLPDRYVLRRWRRDVSRAHIRVAVSYSGLVSTPGQLRYDRMCQAFATIADLAAEDEGRTHAIMEWIGVQEKELMSSRSISGSNVVLQRTTQVSSNNIGSQKNVSCTVLDPNAVNKKGAPKRVRRKGPLKSTSKKATAPSKGKRPTARRTYPPDGASSIQAHQQHDSSMSIPFSYSQLLLGDHDSQVFPQQLSSSTPIHPSSTHPTFNS